MNETNRENAAVARVTQTSMLLGVLLLAAGTSGQAAAPAVGSGGADRTATGDVIRVITYNAQFLPGVARFWNERKAPEYRARTLGHELAAYDIVGLNEMFDKRHRELLLTALKGVRGDACHVVVSPEPPGPRCNGGLAIVSRWAFSETHAMTYSKYSTPEHYGFRADGFAAKGALHARILRRGGVATKDFVDVFVTHLESKDDEIRRFQYGEFAAFVAEHSTMDHPTLMMGDFNTKGEPRARSGPDSDYRLLLSCLGRSRPTVVDLWPALRGDAVGGTKVPDRGRRIDYIFLSNPRDWIGQMTPLAIRVNRFQDPRVGSLSNHAAVEADLHCSEGMDHPAGRNPRVRNGQHTSANGCNR